MDADGGGLIQFTGSPGSDKVPSWSPDGNRIVFVSNREGNEDIFVMNADGTAPINITSSPGHEFTPAWSPDRLHV